MSVRVLLCVCVRAFATHRFNNSQEKKYFDSADYNMHLSHQRADAVRNALVYDGKIAAERVETRWTGETRQAVATADSTAEAGNRVVDIAIH